MVITPPQLCRCDRCGRAEWPVTVLLNDPSIAFAVDFEGVTIAWPDLCDGCRAAVKNALLRLAGRGTEVQPTRRRRDPESPVSAAARARARAADPAPPPRSRKRSGSPDEDAETRDEDAR